MRTALLSQRYQSHRNHLCLCPVLHSRGRWPFVQTRLCSVNTRDRDASAPICFHRHFFHCPSSKKCIPFYQRCDGYRDCLFNEDERDCQGSLLILSARIFPLVLYCISLALQNGRERRLVSMRHKFHVHHIEGLVQQRDRLRAWRRRTRSHLRTLLRMAEFEHVHE